MSNTGNVNTTTYRASKTSFNSPYVNSNNTFSGCDMVATVTIRTSKGTVSQTIGTLQTITVSIVQNKIPVRCLGDINAKDYVDGPRTIAGSLIFTVFDRHWFYSLHDTLKKMGVYTTDHFISDELPPFEITINFENEYGYGARMAIYGVRLMQESQTMSINDIYTENTYQYVAMDVDYMNQWYSLNSDISKDKETLTTTTQSVTPTKAKEIIAANSSHNDASTNEEVVEKINDDYSYSTILTSKYTTLSEYKKALAAQKKLYLAQAEEYKTKYPTQTETYAKFKQAITNNYNKMLENGIQYYQKKK